MESSSELDKNSESIETQNVSSLKDEIQRKDQRLQILETELACFKSKCEQLEKYNFELKQELTSLTSEIHGYRQRTFNSTDSATQYEEQHMEGKFPTIFKY